MRNYTGFDGTFEWTFDTTNLIKIQPKLTRLELAHYGTVEFDVVKFLNNSVLGIRRFIFKEKDEDLPRAKKRAKL